MRLIFYRRPTKVIGKIRTRIQSSRAFFWREFYARPAPLRAASFKKKSTRNRPANMGHEKPDWLRLALFILLNLCCVVHSIRSFDYEGHSKIEIFVSTSQHGFAGQLAFDWLYFENPFLNLHCQLRYRAINDTVYNRNLLVKQYASQGMAPSLTFSSPTWSKTFEFEILIEEEARSTYWALNLTKAKAFQGASFHGNLPWRFKVELGKGLNLFEAQGTLVVSDAEPLLNVKLGDEETESIHLVSPPDGVILWQSPCTPGVAVLVPRLNTVETPFTGTCTVKSIYFLGYVAEFGQRTV